MLLKGAHAEEVRDTTRFVTADQSARSDPLQGDVTVSKQATKNSQAVVRPFTNSHPCDRGKPLRLPELFLGDHH